MSLLKFRISFIFIFFIFGSCCCQTLLGVETGVNWTFLRNPANGNQDLTSCKSFPSYYFAFEIKGRKPKPVHIGVSLPYFQSYFNIQATSSGHFPDGVNINYKYETLGISIFPELSFGKTIQFIFNLGPYFGYIITASKKGTSSGYLYYNNYYVKDETGSATDDFFKFQPGIQETVGIGYLVRYWLLLSIKESGTLGLLPVTNFWDGNMKSENIDLLFGVSFIIPQQQKQETTKSSE